MNTANVIICRLIIALNRRNYTTSQRVSMSGVVSDVVAGAVKRRVDNIVKSAEDKRQYRALELSNHMKVLLISDTSTDKSAASMDVNVGHMSDPQGLPGLAHFLEHMLFLGTDKYPAENEYNKFLSEHGGGSNACTFSDHTNYYFDIVPEQLPGALDRFAQFFLCPLFTESATEREVNAVNSEHEKNVPNDSWRMDQLEKSTARPEHPFSKFGTGNKETLDTLPKEHGVNVRSELLAFHDAWYSSNMMALAVLGRESLDELEQLVVTLFSAVRNKQSQGWSSSLVGGARTGSRGFGFFNINVDLTEEGIERVDDIVALVFDYIAMLRSEGPQEWIFQEYMDIVSMHFRFKDKESPRGYVSGLVHNLHEFPLEEVLSGPYLLSEWRPDLVDMVLGYLSPNNIRVAVVGQKFEATADSSEKWYGTRYKLENIPEDILERWERSRSNPDLSLPPRNEFIPTNFSLAAREEGELPTHPTVIQDTPLARVWFKQDDQFLLPKANVSLEFVSPLAYLDPGTCNMTYMFVQLFKDALNEYAYAAELAGLRWELSNTKYGMVLAVGGYNNKQHVLLERIMDKMTGFKVDPRRFDILKENYVRGLRNFEAEQPYQHAVYYLAVLLAEQAWTKEELLTATCELTLERVEAFIPQLLSKLYVECLIHGNTDRTGALELLLRNRELRLADCTHFVLEVTNKLHRSSCTEIYYQCGLQTTETNMVLELLVQLLTEPCFNILRTQEQLGYIVFSGIRRSNGVQGLRVIVQSDRHPSYVDRRVEAFLENMAHYISNMSDQEFERHKEALVAQRLEKPKKLSVLSARYWSEITSQQYHFDRAEVEVAHLRTLVRQDVLDFYHDMIHHAAPRRHKLAVHVVSVAEGGAGIVPPVVEELDGLMAPPVIDPPTRIDNITSFKSSQGMFPLVQPYININKSYQSKL
uniref:Insulin-degrading enzyme n=1 Tax=Timema monikensis TaxID=170555 RepID=A0A7R9HTU0_9NEOP|nr:unnamed protein product [Timema monikensis]